jgi:hypothetical protein
LEPRQSSALLANSTNVNDTQQQDGIDHFFSLPGSRGELPVTTKQKIHFTDTRVVQASDMNDGEGMWMDVDGCVLQKRPTVIDWAVDVHVRHTSLATQQTQCGARRANHTWPTALR